MNDVAGLHHREPCPCRIVRYPGITAEFRKVDLLGCASGTQLQETGKGLEVAYINDLAYVALDIYRGVISKPLMGRYASIIDSGVSSLPQQMEQLIGRFWKRVYFPEIRRQQHQGCRNVLPVIGK